MATAREQNQVKWVGVRPAHNGTQINISISVSAAFVALYTVPADKVLLLNAVSWSIERTGVAAGRAYFMLRDSVPTEVFNFFFVYSTAQEPWGGGISFPTSFECPTGYNFVVNSAIASLTIHASIHGFLIDG